MRSDGPPVRQRVQELAEQVLPVLVRDAPDVDDAARFPEAGVRLLRDNGLLGLLVPTTYGGLGGDLGDMVTVAQTLATGCLSTAMIWAMHCQQVDAIVRHGTLRLRDELLPKIAAGEHYLASITTEPVKGGHLLTAGASLQEVDQSFKVERHAPVVTGGQHADGYLVTMRESETAPAHRVSLVYVAAQAARVEPLGDWNPLGMRGTHSGGLRLSGMIPAHHMVGRPGEFRAVALDSMIVVGHLAWASCWLGTARSALSDVVALARSRERPRGLDPASELSSERLGRIRLDLEVVGAYLHRVLDEVLGHRRAGRSLDSPETQIHINALKVLAAELTFRAVDRLVQLTGMATGYLKESSIPLERHFRDLRSASLNYADDRLLTAMGKLCLLDRSVRLA